MKIKVFTLIILFITPPVLANQALELACKLNDQHLTEIEEKYQQQQILNGSYNRIIGEALQERIYTLNQYPKIKAAIESYNQFILDFQILDDKTKSLINSAHLIEQKKIELVKIFSEEYHRSSADSAMMRRDLNQKFGWYKLDNEHELNLIKTHKNYDNKYRIFYRFFTFDENNHLNLYQTTRIISDDSVKLWEFIRLNVTTKDNTLKYDLPNHKSWTEEHQNSYDTLREDGIKLLPLQNARAVLKEYQSGKELEQICSEWKSSNNSSEDADRNDLMAPGEDNTSAEQISSGATPL